MDSVLKAECSRDHCSQPPLAGRKMCEGCTDRARARNQMPQNKASQRRSWLRNRYGITPEQWDEMHRQQGGTCAICKGTAGQNLQVDHSHVTGAVRGLLCHKCNKVLGLMRDDVRLLGRAADYLTGKR